MSTTLTIYDETTLGEKVEQVTLTLDANRITVRELIRRRVYDEVQTHNQTLPEYFRGFVQPTDSERSLNGFKLRQRRQIDWEEQYQRAVQAFEKNGFAVLINDRQAEELDEEIELIEDTQASFLRLVPLVGG